MFVRVAHPGASEEFTALKAQVSALEKQLE
jgi:hypothetical protein